MRPPLDFPCFTNPISRPRSKEGGRGREGEARGQARPRARRRGRHCGRGVATLCCAAPCPPSLPYLAVPSAAAGSDQDHPGAPARVPLPAPEHAARRGRPWTARTHASLSTAAPDRATTTSAPPASPRPHGHVVATPASLLPLLRRDHREPGSGYLSRTRARSSPHTSPPHLPHSTLSRAPPGGRSRAPFAAAAHGRAVHVLATPRPR